VKAILAYVIGYFNGRVIFVKNLAISPIEHSISSYVFNSVGKPTSVRVSGCAGSVDEDDGPVRRNAARLRGMTVRSLRAGSHFSLTQAPLAVVNDPHHAGLNVLAVSHLGINNLPKPAQQGIAELLGEVPQLLLGLLQGLHATQAISPIDNSTSSYDNGSDHHGSGHLNPSGPLPLELGALLAQAQALGYANQCELITASVPWRPLLQGAAGGGTGARLLAKATAAGAQTAWVVGPNGLPDDTSAGDLYTDALGRVRIRLTWQGSLGDADGATSGQASCWVRVAQRSAGSGMGLQFLPRVGQEVLVQFLGGDADRPIVVGALYNGQGEGGVLPTPAGAQASGDINSSTNNPFGAAHDSRSSGQGNLMAAGTGGNSPAWFGSVHGKHGESEGAASAGGHANSAAQWGIRTQEWGSSGSGSSAGYNQLVFDDNDTGGGNQQRIHLKTSQYASELSLGHLVHTADNYRGALRGQGFELRTDAYGAIRAGSGLHLSTYPIRHSASARDPAGDNSAALSLLKQAKVLSEAFSQAAGTHATVKLASFEGSTEPTKSAIDEKASPLPALYQASATQAVYWRIQPSRLRRRLIRVCTSVEKIFCAAKICFFVACQTTNLRTVNDWAKDSSPNPASMQRAYLESHYAYKPLRPCPAACAPRHVRTPRADSGSVQPPIPGRWIEIRARSNRHSPCAPAA
jgi:type VI secretion system secreted protein VgrG